MSTTPTPPSLARTVRALFLPACVGLTLLALTGCESKEAGDPPVSNVNSGTSNAAPVVNSAGEGKRRSRSEESR